MELIGKTTKADFFKALDKATLIDDKETKDSTNLDIRNSFKGLCEFIESMFYNTRLKYTYSSRDDFYRCAISDNYGATGLNHQVNGRLSFRCFPKSAQISVRINFNQKYLSLINEAGFKLYGNEDSRYLIAQKKLKLGVVNFLEISELFCSLIESGILEKLKEEKEDDDIFSLWLNNSLVDAFKNKQSELYQPADKINWTKKQTYERYHRDSSLAYKVKEQAKHKCAVDEAHGTFIAKQKSASTEEHTPYMEAHHLVPMSLQGDYKVPLDVIENMLCLCPHCHREFHYGVKKEKLITSHFKVNKHKLKKVGIDISLSKLLEAYKIQEYEQ